jgi:hypothetical protein
MTIKRRNLLAPIGAHSCNWVYWGFVIFSILHGVLNRPGCSSGWRQQRAGPIYIRRPGIGIFLRSCRFLELFFGMENGVGIKEEELKADMRSR